MVDYLNIIKEAVTEPVQDVAYPPNEAPDLPYIIVLDTITHTGGDLHKGLILHDITIERYSTDGEINDDLEAILNAFPADWTRETVWLPAPENCFETIYTLEAILDNT